MHKPLLLAALITFSPTAALAQAAQPWMHTDVTAAWAQGFTGKGTNIVIIDDFTSTSGYRGSLSTSLTQRVQRHGIWVRDFARAIAPDARIATHDFKSTAAVALQAKTLNILNLSYSMNAASGHHHSQINWSARERSIINFAATGQAVIAKAAGNDATIIGTGTTAGKTDYLNSALIGTQGTIFVGALTTNGAPGAQASLASYSNRPGANATVQNQFLAVGVNSAATGLSGTSFAAPIVSGYAAILGSKFRTATPTQITRQLLATARQDTIRDYTPALHGRGEASLSRALAPVAIR